MKTRDDKTKIKWLFYALTSIMTLNGNHPNTLIRRQRLAEWVKYQYSATCSL